MPIVRISEDLFKEIQKFAEPLVDNFETTMWKILQMTGKSSIRVPDRSDVRKNGEHINSKEFWVPILEVINEEGGRATPRIVVDRVEKRLENRFKPCDYDINSDGSKKWEKQLHFQRLEMKHQGLLAKDSPRGVWIITEQGRKWLSEHKTS